MRKLALESRWAALGAKFGELGGAQCVESLGDADAEVAAIRNTAALCDFSFAKKYSYDESEGLDALDAVLAANILKLRYGRIIDTFLAEENGKIAAEVFAGDIDDKLILTAEALGDGLCAPLENAGAGFEDLSLSHVFLSVDGPLAWKAAKGIFGSDIFNLPYLSIEKYGFEGEKVYLMRNGKTGEFGYQFMAPNSVAEKLLDALLKEIEAVGGRPCGMKAHAIARMEGNFFNIYEEGAKVGNPLELGLQWMIDVDKESFAGSEAIFANRSAGVSKKVVALESGLPIACGDNIYNGKEKVGEICAAMRSPTLGKTLALALFDKNFAYAGFGFSTAPGGGDDVKTISRPPILAQSLVKGMEQE